MAVALAEPDLIGLGHAQATGRGATILRVS